MRMRAEHPGFGPGHCAAGRFIIALLLVLCCAVPARAEKLQAFYNPDVLPPEAPEHEPEGNEYFSDAVFIGDSMMEYIEMYELLPTANFAWQIGMSPQSVHRKQFRVRGRQEKVSTYEYAAQYAPRKVYVWLGMNGLDNMPASQLLEEYETMADELLSYFPDALVYVVSPPPMSEEKMNERGVPRIRYADFNEMLRNLAARRNFYYIDMYHPIVDEDGCLPRKYDVGDGYHLTKSAYSIFADLVRRHTVPLPEPNEAKGEEKP